MSTVADSQFNAIVYEDLLAGRLAEDPHRLPHEKEFALHIEGDRDWAIIDSFKKVVFAKLMNHSEFKIERLHVVDSSGKASTTTLGEVVENPDLTVIGVTGRLPMGCLSIGVGRNSNSHADIVK